jgi:hypothetical protein
MTLPRKIPLDPMDIATTGSLYRINHRQVDSKGVGGGCNQGVDSTAGWNGVTQPQAAPHRNPLQNP